ncbi:hypothetical protein EIP86_000595 [Pleurotus ostreatoroseus]|nr:hypothetical protein EIP86_000595 [Pleurotus ostreatoroseus]
MAKISDFINSAIIHLRRIRDLFIPPTKSRLEERHERMGREADAAKKESELIARDSEFKHLVTRTYRD